METIILKEKFSKASKNYDEFSLIQKEIADQLFSRIEFLDQHKNILDIGIGTGYLAEKIKNRYPDLSVYGLDLAFGMLNKAKIRLPEVELTQADARNLPFTNQTFNIIISNLAYQWVGDLDLAFKEANRTLKDKGKFYCTVFSENTLKELRESILKVCDKKLQPLSNLPNKHSVDNSLKNSGFKNIKIDSSSSRYYYPNLAELLNWLKLIGANKYWLNSFYRGLSARCFINDITKYYEEKFRDNGKIFATFEVLFVEASI